MGKVKDANGTPIHRADAVRDLKRHGRYGVVMGEPTNGSEVSVRFQGESKDEVRSAGELVLVNWGGMTTT